MKFIELTDGLKNNRNQFLKNQVGKGIIQIEGIRYNEMYKGKLIAFALLLLGNWKVEFKSENKIDRLYFYNLPIIFIELILELLMVVLMPIVYLITLIFLNFTKNIKTKKIRNKKILYLRTDFLSNLKEGGSFTHVNGFITGAKKLHWSTILTASSKFPNQAKRFILTPYLLWNNIFAEIAEMGYSFRVFSNIKSKKINPSFIYQRHSGFDLSGTFLKLALKKPFFLEVNGLEYWVRKNWGTLHFGWLLKWAEKIIFKHADLIIVVSEVSKIDLIKFGVSSDKIFVNPNGVDEFEFRPNLSCAKIKKKLNINTNDIVAGFVGSFGPWHGIEVLAKVIPKILKKYNNIKFVLIGEGALKKQIEKDLDSYKEKNQVIFTGLVEHLLVPKYLACCDILLSPHIPNKDGTRFFGSPTKLFEYMATGKAIIASDLEQIGEILADKKTALMVSPGDVSAIVKNIDILIKNINLRKNLGKNARKEAIEKYSWKINAQNVINKLDLKI